MSSLHYVFNANVSSTTKRPVSDVISTVARLREFDWHNIFLWKLLQSEVSILLDKHIIN